MKQSSAARWPYDPVTFYDSRREREFYRYYEPLCAPPNNGNLPLVDMSGGDAPHHARSSPDTSLTSFCQLGALRLKTRRCMLLFFDTEFAYVLAEATQTLSLQDDNDHDENDGLWLGTAIIPRGYSICEHTVNISDYPAANRGSNQHETNRSDVQIISNLTDDVRFCDQPFVLGQPMCRFYAGVPIITPTGASIGTYCVLDDKPRAGLSEKEVAFLRQMSRTVMDHLETVRAKSVYGRGSRMLTSLDAFFKTAPQASNTAPTRSPFHRQNRGRRSKITRKSSMHSSDSGEHANNRPPRRANDNRRRSAPDHVSDQHNQQLTLDHGSIRQSTLQKLASDIGQQSERPEENVEHPTEISQTTADKKDFAEPSSTSAALTEVPQPTTDIKDFAEPNNTSPAYPSDHTGMSGEGVVTRNASDPDDDLDNCLEDSIEKTFQIAAELIQQASESDAVVFIDVRKRANAARISRRCRRKSRNRQNNFTSTDTDFTSTDGSIVTDSDENKPRDRPAKRFPILGRARSSQQSSGQPLTSHYPSSIIRYMMKRYHRGHIWNFDSDGMASATESASDMTENSSDVLDSASSDRCQEQKVKPSPREHRSATERRMFQGLFPGVRAVSFVPLWDTRTEKIYAVALLTTYSPLRVLSNHGDLSFVRAFCDVVMASVGRLESASEEQAKTQFISSISHELRSPLHGILGGIDLLQSSDRPDQMILSQIEKCSTNLIDIIEHLLEYAKINNLSNQHTQLPGHPTSTHRSAADGVVPDNGISLAELTEDVADSVFYAHSYATEDQSQPVEYIIDSSLEPSWLSNISVGAWKRLCMNILNNALKHTTHGHIKVSLSLLKRSSNGEAALLTISDTGAGMSKEFLNNGLFQAFRQENSLTPGTGLGMSLVAKLVKSIGGAIEVRSEKHVGTTVKVIVPLVKTDSVPQPIVNQPLQGVRASIYAVEKRADASTELRAHELQVDAIEKHCATQGITFDSQQPEVLFVFQADLLSLSAQEKSSLFKGIRAAIVLCGRSRDATCNAVLKELSSPGVQFACISQPFGPSKIQRVLQACLLLETNTNAGAASDCSSDLAQATNGSLSSDALPQRPQLISQLRSLSQRLIDRTSDTTITPSDIQPPPMDQTLPPAETPKELTSQPGISKVIDVLLPDKMPLLLVDDNEINLRILQMYAKQNKHPYMTATDGLKAVEAYETAFTRHDKETNTSIKIYAEVIFMDINMPVMSGFEATRQIRLYERTHGLRPAVIIALTGLGSLEAQEQAASSGVDIFLTKPVRSKELTMVLQSISVEAAPQSGV